MDLSAWEPFSKASTLPTAPLLHTNHISSSAYFYHCNISRLHRALTPKAAAALVDPSWMTVMISVCLLKPATVSIQYLIVREICFIMTSLTNLSCVSEHHQHQPAAESDQYKPSRRTFSEGVGNY